MFNNREVIAKVIVGNISVRTKMVDVENKIEKRYVSYININGTYQPILSDNGEHILCNNRKEAKKIGKQKKLELLKWKNIG